jgi:hypothetical protein
MSHSIVFETKIVKLTDGRILHLDRSGCNNDDAGRNRDEFTGKIYTQDEFIKYANSFMNNENLDSYELKLGSKWISYNEYGTHLLRMLKRAIPYADFIKERRFYGIRFDGVELFEPERKTLTAEEFDKVFYDLLYGNKSLSYRRILTYLYTEEETINAIEQKQPVSFYVGKKYKVA